MNDELRGFLSEDSRFGPELPPFHGQFPFGFVIRRIERKADIEDSLPLRHLDAGAADLPRTRGMPDPHLCDCSARSTMCQHLSQQAPHRTRVSLRVCTAPGVASRYT